MQEQSFAFKNVPTSEKKKRNSPGGTIAESQVFCWHCQVSPAFALHQAGTHCEPRTPSLTLMLPVPTSAPTVSTGTSAYSRDHRTRLQVWLESVQLNQGGLSWYSKCMWPEMLLESVHISKSLLSQLTSSSESSLSMDSTLKKVCGKPFTANICHTLRTYQKCIYITYHCLPKTMRKIPFIFSLSFSISITQTTATRQILPDDK